MRRRRLRLVAPSARAARPAAAANGIEDSMPAPVLGSFSTCPDDEATFSSTAGTGWKSPSAGGTYPSPAAAYSSTGAASALLRAPRSLRLRSLAPPVVLFRPPPLADRPLPG